MKSKVNLQTFSRLFAATLFLTVGLFIKQVPAVETSDVRVARMAVDIWPEYDDPRVLVIYSGQLDPDVALPTEFSILIPQGAQIHMAGAIGPNGGHIHAQFLTRPKGENLTEVYYQLKNPKFYMEFYYDPFPGGENKQFSYPLVSPYTIASLVVKVQQPLKARDFRTMPIAVNIFQDQKGFNYHRLVFEKVKASEKKSVTVSYVKKDKKPSVAKEGSTASGSKAMRNILIIGGVLLVGIIAFGLVVNSRTKKKPVLAAGGSGRPQPNKGVASAEGSQSGKYKYCTECGTRMQRSDNFCPNCGNKTNTV